MAALLLAALFFAPVLRPAQANGIPVQVFLDFLPFKATWEPASAAKGVAVVAANDEKVRVMAQNLPAPPPGKVYYAWLEQTAGGYLPVGELAFKADGTASIDQNMADLPYSENFTWVLVSLEDPGQVSNEPAADIALAGRLPNPVALPDASDELPALLPVTGGNAPAAAAGVALGMSLVLLVLFVAVTLWVLARRRQLASIRSEAHSRHQARALREQGRKLP